MKRLTILLLATFLVMCVCGFTIFWLFGTTEGARWVIGAISRTTSLKIEAQKISGQIGHELKMEGLRVSWPKGEMKVEGFHLQWQPLYLLLGKARIEKLVFHEVQIKDDRPEHEKVFDLQWPRVPGMTYWIHGKIRLLDIDKLKYHHLEQNLFIVEKLSSRLDWHHGLLILEEIDLDIPSGRVKGALELGLLSPSLYLNLDIIPSESVIGFDKLHLNSRLLPARSSDQVAGNVFIEGISRSVKQLLIESEIGITQKAVILQKLLISHPNRQGTLMGDGRIIFAADDILMNFRMRFSDMDLFQELTLKTAFSGSLHIEGNPNDYRGDIRIENTKGKWYSGYLSGTFKGGLQEAHMTILDGSLLDGNFQGHLTAQWGEGLSLKGALQARNINPASITPDWDGKINLDLKGTFHSPEETSSEGRLRAHLLQSHVRGQPLTGDIELHMEKSILRIARADLKGKGFDLFAKGVLQEKVTFHADISDLSGLIPGTRGSLFAKGWARWRNRQLAMDLDSKGKDLFIKDIKIGTTSFSARLIDHEHDPVEIKGEARKITYRSLNIDSAALDVRGRLARHKIFFTMHLPEGKVNGVVEGGYSQEVWQGTVVQLVGSDPNGSWQMEDRATLSISSHQIALKSFSINSSGKERLRVSTDLTFHPLRGSLQAEWRSFDLSRANPWLGKQHLSGHTTGYLSLQWLEEDRLRMAGMVNLSGTLMDTPLKIGVSEGSVKFNWNEKGLLASWELKDTTGGKLWGNLSSPQPGEIIIPEHGKIETRWEAIDLALFQALFPQRVTLEGHLRGQLSVQWADRMRRFGAEGKLKVSEGMVRWQYRKDKIIKALQAAEVRCEWKDNQLSGNLSLRLEEMGSLIGSFGIPLISRWPTSIQPNNPIHLSLQGEFQDEELVATFFPDLIQESRGKVDVNLRADGTWEKPRLHGLLKLKKTEVHLLAGKTQIQTAKNNISETSLKLELAQGLMKFNWDEKELLLTWDLDFEKNGKFQGNLSSPQPAQMAFPDKGAVAANWEGIDLSLLKPYLPQQLFLEGSVVGHLSGQWSNRQLDTSGEIRISQGVARWENEGGSIRAPLRSAHVKWAWRDDHLLGDFSLALVEYGYANGSFQLPLSAQWPTAIRAKDPIRLSLEGQFQEKGLLQALFPGMVQESQGQIHLNLIGDGTWERPNLEGNLKLEKAGAYLPVAGIRLEEFTGEAQFKGEEIRIASFRTRSGPGQIEGNATVRIENWKVSHYEGHLKGEHFQTIHLPELRVLSSPRLDFHGTTQKLFVRGEILLPDILISGPPTKDVIRPSPDVMVVDMPEVTKKGLPILPDIQVRLLLGEKVYYKAEGIDVRLKGDLRLNVQDPYKTAAAGEIGVAQGHYSFYGQRLEIIRGRLLFAGGSVENPTVDALAVRKIGDVQAGVTVTGSLQKPIVKLYSRPSMTDTDILAYLVLGQPLGKGTEAVPSLMQAAGALLSAGESVILQGQLKKLFGLDTLDITTPPGGDEVSRSMVTIGKHLTPKLYISLGRSLFTDATLVTLRYTLSKRLEIETTTGTESGATLFYRIEFR